MEVAPKQVRQTKELYIQPLARQPTDTIMLISLTVGKVDAGVAVLLTQDKRLVSHQFQL